MMAVRLRDYFAGSLLLAWIHGKSPWVTSVDNKGEKADA
jgi:hypothetical protein